jgi:cytosine/adenosine deaminase-related metal-dependent hydrolase
MILKARFILPIDAPPIEDGAIVVRDGRISAVGTAREISGRPTTDFADAVILPGLVNAHTHLELTLLRGKIANAGAFTDWLSNLVRSLRDEPPTAESTAQAVNIAVRDSLRCGVTSLGDITRFPDWTRPILAQTRMRAVSFGEVVAIGRRRHLFDSRLARAASREFATANVRIGISPHAPYTVEPDAMHACADRAAAERLPLCIHLAETPEEETFTATRSGPFVDYLQSLGVWDDDIPAAGCSPVELADRTGLLTDRTLIAHANYVRDADFPLLAARRVSVAYCPRTHHAFGHPPHPFLYMLDAGVNVCLGTDSLASNPSLSLLEEMRFLHASRPEAPSDAVLRMATLNGAIALGLSGVTGSINPGKSADLVVLPLDSTAERDTVASALLRSDSLPLAVYANGRSIPVP